MFKSTWFCLTNNTFTLKWYWSDYFYLKDDPCEAYVKKQKELIKSMRSAATTLNFNRFWEELKDAMTTNVFENIKCLLQGKTYDIFSNVSAAFISEDSVNESYSQQKENGVFLNIFLLPKMFVNLLGIFPSTILFTIFFSSNFRFIFVSTRFIVSPENFLLIWRRHHYLWRAANVNFDLCSALMAIEQ